MSEASETKKRNRLAGETSPYLLQHASNPVDWYPWGEEALCRAKDLDRPIFLSIGYSSCHWCHVMERESFENPEIAGVLNEHFISIKVDREERPDIDAIYMTAVQMMTGTGGWPLSVFLTPELKPFWGGTYFPPESRYGRPGFEDILRSIAGGYREQREKLEEFASELTGWIRKEERSAASAELPGEDSLKAVVSHADQTFDAHNGGFGAAPKFPRPIEISNLLRYHCRAREARILHMCEKTLEAMAHGGIYDQVGGGFHRYSTDERWIVPHFEKMLYDNALLARTYLEAFQSTGNDAYARIAREVLDYVLREMTSPEGGFYSATDADSEGEEGKFFVWTPDQVEAVLGKDDARIVCEWFNITPGGNFEHRTSIPHVTRSVEDVAKSLNISPGTVRETVKRGRDALYRAREQRAKPFRDEKVLTCWNGLMISAFVKGFQVTEEPRYLDAARRAADLILAKLWIDGRLHRTYKDGKARIAAFLDDHAYLGEALLDLYEATFQPEYLERARDMMDFLLAHFWDEGGGGFFFAGDHQESLISRKRDDLDSSTPSGNGVAALNLLRLERLTGVAAYRDRAERLFRSVKGLLDRFAAACGSTVLAVDFYMGPPVEIVLIGDLAGAAGRDLLRAVHRSFLPNRVIAGAVEPIPESLWRTAPLLEGKKTVDGVPTAYVCRDRACGAPVTTPEALRAQLDSAR